MAQRKILFIGGSLNQTTMMHKIARQLEGEHDCFFTPYYCDGAWLPLQRAGVLDFTIIGGQNRRGTEKYFADNGLRVDYAGLGQKYDLMVTCTDMMVQKNTQTQPLILVQEGMTDPENFMYEVVRRTHRLGVPRWLASTSTTGLSDKYDRFCVASEGYRRLFAKKGCRAEKLVVTGIPNYDNAVEYLKNDFPHHHYVLVATTDTRENFKIDFRARFLRRCKEIAGARQLIFKLHPNENRARSTREIDRRCPGSLVYQREVDTSHLIANCDVLVTQYSTVVYTGLALGKEVHSYFDLDELKELVPIQNGGASAKNIADVCREYLC